MADGAAFGGVAESSSGSGRARTGGELELCREEKVSRLLGEARKARLEVSGVVAVDGGFYAIFDNTSQIGWIDPMLSPGAERNRLIAQKFGKDTGYEDIAYDASSGRFFILI